MHCPIFIFGAIIGSSEARGLLGSPITVKRNLGERSDAAGIDNGRSGDGT